MYNFQNNLLSDEKILYEGKPVPGKGGKNIGGFIFLICFVLLIQILLIWSVTTKTGDGAEGMSLGFIIIFLVSLLFLGLGVYGLLYNLVLKKKKVEDEFYCLTNMRAMKYNFKKNELVFGYLTYYDDIHCDNVKNNFGDLYMGILMDEESTGDTAQALLKLKDMMMNPNPENMPYINFESIENPYKVMEIAKNAKKEILQKINEQQS